MINIIGAGLAGLAAAIECAKSGRECRLISKQPSERAQSVLAEGGINAALDTMGENDTWEEHFNDTMNGGVQLADPNAVENLTKNAPETVRYLINIGAGLNMQGDKPVLRNFGGQKKKRTAFAKTGTGKIIMTALINESRKYEAKGLIHRYMHHSLSDLYISGGKCYGAEITDEYSGEILSLDGAVILACGGLNGFFDGASTGTTQNDGTAAVIAFARGAELANLEFIQYHPTTISISGKRMLISEAARGEGGRLYIKRNNKNYYFMEEKYPELGNLMPRDVVSREMYSAVHTEGLGNTVFLDMSGVPQSTWDKKLSDLRKECIHYLSVDPAKEDIPVEPGIHYFMGGINVDETHKTNIDGLYAAGECAAQYHGANRLGGNSMLGAVYGGITAAKNITDTSGNMSSQKKPAIYLAPENDEKLKNALIEGLGIVRSETTINAALEKLYKIDGYGENARLALGEAMLLSALGRRESRGAHCRSDFPDKDENYRRTSIAVYCGGNVTIDLRDIPKRRENSENKA